MKTNILTVAFFAAFSASGAVMAEGYISGAVGVGRGDFDCAGVASCDKTGTAYKLFGGYKFGNGFAAEVGYIGFGQAKASDGSIRAKAQAGGVMVGLAYLPQFNSHWGVALRLGAASIHTRISGSVAGFGSAGDSETNTVPYFGVGLNYALNRQTRLELAADFSEAEYQSEKADVRAITLGLRYDF